MDGDLRHLTAWEPLQRPAPDVVVVDGVQLRAGSRVRLAPRPGGDVMDLVLAGRTAVVESVEQDVEGQVRLAVVVEDDPGRELGLARQPGHRFFFSAAEVEPLPGPVAAPAPRVLVAGIGNVFLGDDGFGVALAQRLAARAPLPGVEVRDFGIRGMELAYTMLDGYDAVVLLDATPRGERPGTLFVIEVDDDAGEPSLDAHGMDPVKVLGLARALGGPLPRTFVVGCEPLTRMSAEDPELVAELSAPVTAALDRAVALAESLLAQLRDPSPAQADPSPAEEAGGT